MTSSNGNNLSLPGMFEVPNSILCLRTGFLRRKMMKTGTKSLLFGVHQVFLHPLFVFAGWIKLYGCPNWREFVCILIHDWGYWGCSNMDGIQGSHHPYWAADFLSINIGWEGFEFAPKSKYYWLCLLHSRFLAERLEMKPSKLCWADKLGTALYPTWFWVFLSRLSGEQKEYLSNPHHEIHGAKDPYEFFNKYKTELVPKLLKENGFLG